METTISLGSIERILGKCNKNYPKAGPKPRLRMRVNVGFGSIFQTLMEIGILPPKINKEGYL
jgi:hypothetical protein